MNAADRMVIALLMSACGSGAATQTTSPSMTPMAAGGSAPTGGSTSTTSAGIPAANGGSGAPSTAPAVMCGQESCTAPMALPAVSTVTPMACCLDAASSSCGYMVSGSCTPPAPDAPKCPALMIALGKACCTSNNICGIDATAFGMGCMDILPGAKTMCDGTRAAPGGATAGSSAATSGSGGANAAGSGGAKMSR